MSASLVGSEMCIRDRSPPVPATATGTRAMTPATMMAKPSLLVVSARGSPCLLYTSDAADDM
eukprot:10787885-Alexandrium_andersonii.AAC.1